MTTIAEDIGAAHPEFDGCCAFWMWLWLAGSSIRLSGMVALVVIARWRKMPQGEVSLLRNFHQKILTIKLG